MAIAHAGFGGGCHWCTEAVFQSLNGVTQVAQGYIASDSPHDSYSEAVDVHWNPDEIGFDDLIGMHLVTHASSSDRKMRGKYRSAIYVDGDEARLEAQAILERLSAEIGQRFVTSVLPYRSFKPSDERFQDYYARNREGPFCEAYIEPKLALLRQRFGQLQQSAQPQILVKETP